jgi:hypothetical protein
MQFWLVATAGATTTDQLDVQADEGRSDMTAAPARVVEQIHLAAAVVRAVKAASARSTDHAVVGTSSS